MMKEAMHVSGREDTGILFTHFVLNLKGFLKIESLKNIMHSRSSFNYTIYKCFILVPECV